MSLFSLSLALLPDIGGGEMIMIMFVVLLLFGGEKLPQFAKGFGKAVREFKKAANEVEREIKRAIDEVPDSPDLKSTFFGAAEPKPKAIVSTPTLPVEPPPAAPPSSVPALTEPLPPAAITPPPSAQP